MKIVVVNESRMFVAAHGFKGLDTDFSLVESMGTRI